MITVKPALTASEIKGQIERALLRSAEVDANRIQVEVDGSKVILTGMVRSSAEKDAAQRIVWSAPGVTAVDNRIAVSY